MNTLTLRTPDDWHLHLRDGAALQSVVAASARQMGRAIIMPNLKPPVTTVAEATAYRDRIRAALNDAVARGEIDRAQAAAIVSEAAGKLDKHQKNFVQVLADNGRLAQLPDIAALFEQSRDRHENVLEATIESAFELTDAQKAAIVDTLKKRFGKGIKATTTVNPELIGGVSIQIGDEVIDASVRGKLSQLAASLTK